MWKEITKNAMRALLLASASFMPQTLEAGNSPQDIAKEDVSLVEHNHFYDDQGRHVFDQLVFYDWSWEAKRFQVRAWRLMKSDSQIPVKNHETGEYDVTFQDGEILRKIRAKSARETWTQYDPELVEREFLPKEKRRDLYYPPKIVKKEKPAPGPENVAAAAVGDGVPRGPKGIPLVPANPVPNDLPVDFGVPEVPENLPADPVTPADNTPDEMLEEMHVMQP